MADAAAKKDIGGGFLAESSQHVVLEYDFANDGGATGSFTLGVMKQKCVIKGAYIHVVTAATSTGSATVAVGTTDDADGILDITSGAVAALTTDKVLAEVAGANGLFADAGDSVLLVIATEDLTAGKIQVHLDIDLLSS